MQRAPWSNVRRSLESILESIVFWGEDSLEGTERGEKILLKVSLTWDTLTEELSGRVGTKSSCNHDHESFKWKLRVSFSIESL